MHSGNKFQEAESCKAEQQQRGGMGSAQWQESDQHVSFSFSISVPAFPPAAKHVSGKSAERNLDLRCG